MGRSPKSRKPMPEKLRQMLANLPTRETARVCEVSPRTVSGWKGEEGEGWQAAVPLLAEKGYLTAAQVAEFLGLPEPTVEPGTPAYHATGLFHALVAEFVASDLETGTEIRRLMATDPEQMLADIRGQWRKTIDDNRKARTEGRAPVKQDSLALAPNLGATIAAIADEFAATRPLRPRIVDGVVQRGKR